VLLAAPVSPDDRLAELGRRTRGFLYAVTVMGVTGARSGLSDTAATLARRCRAVTDVPVLLGFGVSTPAQAKELAEDADGVIVASALMRQVLDGVPADEVAELVAAMRSGLG
jgi:tryptophan synthase alpha chain